LRYLCYPFGDILLLMKIIIRTFLHYNQTDSIYTPLLCYVMMILIIYMNLLLCCCCFLICFLCFIRLFWNQVFTWVSDRFRAPASSTRSGVERYRWDSNRFSKPKRFVRTLFKIAKHKIVKYYYCCALQGPWLFHLNLKI
jgi:hypothetical protein